MESFDCAGSAGLTAALDLRRFHRCWVLFYGGLARAALIPRSHNPPALPDGIRGPELLDRMQARLARFGGARFGRPVTAVVPTNGRSEVIGDEVRFTVRGVILATGLGNRLPPQPDT